MFMFGVVGYLFEKYGFPITPMVIAMVLGPIIESSLRRAMLLANNDPIYLLTKPISAVLLIAALVSTLFPFVRTYIERRKAKPSQGNGV